MASMVYKFFDKKTASHANKSPASVAVKDETMKNEKAANFIIDR